MKIKHDSDYYVNWSIKLGFNGQLTKAFYKKFFYVKKVRFRLKIQILVLVIMQVFLLYYFYFEYFKDIFDMPIIALGLFICLFVITFFYIRVFVQIYKTEHKRMKEYEEITEKKL